MTSNGGMLAADVTCEKPVLVVASGPAGGVVGAARLGIARDDRDVIVFDMGGTTAKAVIIEDGRPTMTSEYEFRDGISTSSRFIKAGGYMLKVPAIDIAEVGAGGGSLASIDHGGLLVVGPQSAGAVPGPACYGLGNDRPTVTDANVVLGFINPNSLAGGKLAIDRRAARRRSSNHVGKPLGLPLADAAHGIRAVANAAMARAVRAVTVERGRDPRDLTLMAFGGNGGVHAPDLARQLGIPRVVVPPMSGVFSALGMLASDIEHTGLKTVGRRLDAMTRRRSPRRSRANCKARSPRSSLATAITPSAPRSSGRPICATRARRPSSPCPSRARISRRSASASSPNISRPTAIATIPRSS